MHTRQKTNPENFWKFTDDEMEIAKNTDLPDLLEHLGYRLRRVGGYYTTKEMDSLRIKNRRTWRRYSNDTHGDAITFLQEFEGKDFREAVTYLLDFNGRARDSPALSRSRPKPRPAPKEEKPEFILPPANEDSRRVFAYLRYAVHISLARFLRTPVNSSISFPVLPIFLSHTFLRRILPMESTVCSILTGLLMQQERLPVERVWMKKG